jgi:hypothetical protein
MLATDPLSLVFLGCVVFSGAFLVISMVSGIGHGHLLHIGHSGHLAHVAHAPAASGGHAGHAAPHAHATAHVSHSGPAGSVSSAAHLWSNVTATLLSSLNLFGILTFLFCFGLLGYLLHNATNVGVALTIALPVLFGAAGALGLSVTLTRLFAVETGALTVEGSRLEGRLGKVSLTIRSGGVGEVIFARAGGGRQSVGARSVDGELIPADTEVVIVSVRDGIASVQTWEAFMRNAHGGHSTPLEPIEPGP